MISVFIRSRVEERDSLEVCTEVESLETDLKRQARAEVDLAD